MSAQRNGTNHAFEASLIFLVIVAMIIGAITLKQTIDENIALKADNAAFKAQNAEWQQATVPALRARGWWASNARVEDVRPEHLTMALNPCKWLSVGAYYAFAVKRCGDSLLSATSNGSPGVPFKIELVDNWP